MSCPRCGGDKVDDQGRCVQVFGTTDGDVLLCWETDQAERAKDAEDRAAATGGFIGPKELFDPPPSPAGAPETARDAAASMAGRPAATLRARVLDLLTRAGPLTCESIEDVLELRHQTVGPRLWELRRAGLVRDSSARRTLRSGRQGVLWELGPEPRKVAEAFPARRRDRQAASWGWEQLREVGRHHIEARAAALEARGDDLAAQALAEVGAWLAGARAPWDGRP